MPLTRRADGPVARELAAALASARLGAAQAFAAWPIMLGRIAFYVLILVVLSALWDKVVAEQIAPLAKSLPAGGLSAYIAVTEWVTLSVVGIQLRLEDDIRRGSLEPYLLRPKSYLLQRLSPAFGETVVRLGVLGVAGLAVIAATGCPLPGPAAWLPLLLLGCLGAIIGTLLYTLAGLTAFWLRRVMPPMLIIQKLSFLLGGLLAPISLYPDWLFEFAKTTPFAAHLYWVGHQYLTPSLRLFVIGLAWQLVWIAILAAMCGLIWRAGLRKVQREGL